MAPYHDFPVPRPVCWRGCRAIRNRLDPLMSKEQLMSATASTGTRILYWHRELPPLTAEAMGEYTLEATSRHVAAGFSRADEEWGRCYGDLMTQARDRLEQEVARLGGHYAHVGEELISPQHDDRIGEAWLYGRFKYVLYREPTA
jgi:hypothetical protein